MRNLLILLTALSLILLACSGGDDKSKDTQSPADVPAEEVGDTPEGETDAPAEDVPVDETKDQTEAEADAPAEDAPAEDAPAEDAPAEDAPAEDAPAEE